MPVSMRPFMVRAAAMVLGMQCVGALGQPAAAPRDPVTLAEQAQAAWFADDAAALSAFVAASAAWANSRDNQQLYAYAYVQFRALQSAVARQRKDDAVRAGEGCTDALDLAVARDATFAEGFALQSACYGYLAGLGGFGAIRNGARSGKAIDAATKLAPRNPRVLLIRAFGLYFRPKFVGGDKIKACALFHDATLAFDAAPPAAAAERRLVRWGAPEAHLWAGRCAADAGDRQLAQREYRQALTLAPDFIAATKRLENP